MNSTKPFKFKQLFQLFALVTLLTACTAPNVQPESPRTPDPIKARSSDDAADYSNVTQVTYPPTSAVNEQRVALVIGNSNYPGDLLPNPVHDAEDLTKVLRGYGFTVIHKSDLNKQKMDEAIIEFGQSLGKNGVGLFFFAGHGIQIQQHNYLIPIGPKIQKASLVKYRAIEAQQVVDIMNEAGSRVNIVILDACRDNPYRSYFRSQDGLATMAAPHGTLISYSTAPGKKAADGDGRNGLFTEHLLDAIKQSPGSTIEEILKQTAGEVAQKSGGRQVPWRLSSLTGKDFCFSDCAKAAHPPPPPPPKPKPQIQTGNVFQDRLKDGSLGPKMVRIPAGRFRMGDIQGGGNSDEQPVHSVSVNQFAMGVYEVTVGEFRQFVNTTGYRTEAEKKGSCYVHSNGSWKAVSGANWLNPGDISQTDKHPVICVSWNDATVYMEWLSEQTGHQYRLPTEAQWEYAARAGTETKYWWGNTVFPEYANFGKDECCEGFATGKDRWVYTAPVGSFAKNPFGLYDTVGNVWEWTCSEYENKYAGKEQRCAKDAGLFVVRSGSWFSNAGRARSAARSGFEPAERYDYCGVRPARIR